MGEIRKVQQTPGGTFFICIPKGWAERYGLKRGSTVMISETSDGKLLIDPEYGAVPLPRSITLKPTLHLSREIIGKYLLGFDIIRVENKHISFEVREEVKRTASRLVGLEIIEENHSKIVLQCLLEPTSFPPDKILRREHSLVASMHQDVLKALIEGDVSLAKSIIARDEEVDRLYFLLIRILRTIIQNPSLSEKLGVCLIDCLDYRLAASLVENIGDECVRIACKVVALNGQKISNNIMELLLKFHKLCFSAHENAVRALLTGNVPLALTVSEMSKEVEAIFNELEKNAKAQDPSILPNLLAALSALKQIYAHGADIADLVMPRKFSHN
ncbi:MAG: PhoU domain-containing protein [Candidatus Bathyarchaeia archaeon]